MPKTGSVNQIEPSDFTTTSLGELSRLPSRIHQHRDRAVIFGPDDASAAVLAADQPALAVAGVAIGEVGRFAKDADRAGFFFPFEDAVIGDIAAQQITPVAKPHRAFAPAQPGLEPLDRG